MVACTPDKKIAFSKQVIGNRSISSMDNDYAKELSNLRKLRATLQAVKESTDKILQDVETVYKNNHPQLLEQSKDLEQTINKVVN